MFLALWGFDVWRNTEGEETCRKMADEGTTQEKRVIRVLNNTRKCLSHLKLVIKLKIACIYVLHILLKSSYSCFRISIQTFPGGQSLFLNIYTAIRLNTLSKTCYCLLLHPRSMKASILNRGMYLLTESFV